MAIPSEKQLQTHPFKLFEKALDMKTLFPQSVKSRRLQFEPLEERQLLAVSAVEFNQIRSLYPDLNLSANMSDYNVIEVTAAQLSETNLRNAINTAGTTTANDLIVVRNNGQSYVDLGNNTLKIDIDSNLYGSINIVSFGAGILQLQSSADTGVVQVINGNVALGGVVLCGVENVQAETVSVFNLIQTGAGANVQTSRVVNVTENSNRPGNFTILGDAQNTSGPLASSGSLIGTKSYSITFGVGGTLEAYLTGLSQAEKNTIVAGSMDFLSLVTPYDAEKTGIDDSMLCWAGSASNMLAYTGWGSVNGFQTEDDILDCFRSNFTDLGGSAYYGNDWFITGHYTPQGWDGWSQQIVSDSGGFYRDSSDLYNNDYNTIARYVGIGDANDITTSVNCLKAGAAVGLSIGWYDASHVRQGGHAITMWGAIYNTAKSPVANDYYVSLLISDSDDNYGGGVNAPNLLKNLSLQWTPSYNSYNIYSKSGYLEGFAWLDKCAPLERSTIVTMLDDVVDPYDGLVSLREAIGYANPGDTVTFATALHGQTITLNGSELLIDKDIAIDATRANITINANQQSRVFNIANSTVGLAGLTITGGKTSNGGGGIYSSGSMLKLTDCTVSGNTATSSSGIGSYGGGIYSGGTHSGLTLTNCTVSGNTVSSTDTSGMIPVYGGGIYNGINSQMILTNCTISENTAKGSGGGIYSTAASTLTNCFILGNSAYSGGGFFNDNGTVMFTNCEVSWNSASNAGGIYSNNGKLTLTNSTISWNSALYYEGGGISSDKGTVMLTNCAIVMNSAGHIGGGIYSATGTLTIMNCTVSGNKANGNGGGIHISAGTLNVYNTIVARNTGGSDIYNSLSTGTITGANNLTTFTTWSSGSANLVYDSGKPLFVDAVNGDYRLAQNSQAIDKGNNAYIPSGVTTDIAGKSRIAGGTVDIGAYEYQSMTPPPAVPANFVATAVSTKTVLLTWDAVANAESYNVYRYDSTVSGGWRLLATVAGTSWTQGGYTPGGTYAFRISAVNAQGESPLSETKKATMVVPGPLTPANFVAVAVNTKTVQLTWNAVANAESYNVYRYDSTVAGGWKLAENVTGTSWTQGGYTPGGTYAFRVSAVNTQGESPLSETKKATMVMPAPLTPTNFVAVAVNTKTVQLTWNAVANAESYNVYRYDSTVAGGWKLAANVAGTSWTQGGYTPGGTYAFRVSAVNAQGESPLSETKKATMVVPEPLTTPMSQALISYLDEEFLI